MKEVSIITGPMRSGTSCITGLLECCGFNLGNGIRILRNKTEHNPSGHFELDLLFTINERLLAEVPNGPWDIFYVPDEHAISNLAANREKYFNLFLSKFDGNICKDPLLCLTLPLWEKHWPQLTNAVFCLRHPLTVAHSMKKRYGLSVEKGLELWHIYTNRFYGSIKRCRVFILDFDAFIANPVDVLMDLLNWLGKRIDKGHVKKHIADFFKIGHVHWSFKESDLDDVPIHIKKLYLEMRSHPQSIGGKSAINYA